MCRLGYTDSCVETVETRKTMKRFAYLKMAAAVAAAVMAAIPLLVFIVRRVIPRDRGRLDLLFMAYVLTAMAGVMVTV